MPGRAGHRALLLVDDEVVQGEPAGHRRAQRPGLDHRVVPGLAVVSAGLAGAVGRVTIDLQSLLLPRSLLLRRAPRTCVIVCPGIRPRPPPGPLPRALPTPAPPAPGPPANRPPRGKPGRQAPPAPPARRSPDR